MSSRYSQRRRDQSTDWSGWEWDASREKYYKVRKDRNGRWEYSYWDSTSEASTSETTPRTVADSSDHRFNTSETTSMSALSDRFANTNIAAESNDSYVFTNSSPGQTNAIRPDNSRSTHDVGSSSRFIPSGSGSREFEAVGPIPISSDTTSSWEIPSTAQTNSYTNAYDGGSGTRGDFSPSSSIETYSEAGSYGSDANTPVARGHSFPATYTRQTPAESTGYSGSIIQEDVHRVIRGTRGEKEKLDPKFRIHKSKHFQPGEVFKVLWTEPKGSTVSNTTDVTGTSLYGEEFFSKIRRFVIVAADHGHCQCVPILTYQSQGTAKWGVKQDEHAIIYTSADPPPPMAGEGTLNKGSIQVIPKTPRDKLASSSRVNYAKIYTVEHNVKVQFIGSIAKNDQWRFNADFDATWAAKRTFNTSY